MKKIKVSKADGPALDWLMAKALGQTPFVPAVAEKASIYLLSEDGSVLPQQWNPSTDWSQGGPIIEVEWIELVHDGNTWEAIGRGFGEDAPVGLGPTPLIAAIRCFVVNKIGDEAEVPEELL